MSNTTPDYITSADHGDETDVRREPGAEAPPLPGTWVARFDAAYWQAQAETAIRALEQALATLAQVEAERDAALAQLRRVKQQLAQTSAVLSDERRAAATQRGRR